MTDVSYTYAASLPCPPHWMDRALCAETDPDLFFDASGEHMATLPSGKRESAAKAVCGRCPVQVECLEHALAHDERFGIWGGLNEKERRAMRGRRGRLA